MHTCVFEILQDIQHGTKSDFIFLLQEKANILLNSLIKGCFLRQVYLHVVDKSDNFALKKVVSTPLIPETENPNFHYQLTMVKQRDHRSE